MTGPEYGGPRVGDLSSAEFAARLSSVGLGLEIGPFNGRLRIECPDIYPDLQRLYREYLTVGDTQVYSFHAHLRDVRLASRLWRRRVRFSVDGYVPHADMPARHAIPTLEWGINLVIAMRAHNFLMLHAAVVERQGFALVLPATPGSGKTTLCAALGEHGWRVFSDEFGLVRPETIELIPVPRPMVLKNDSIDLLASTVDPERLGPKIEGTRKGTVAHLAPPPESIRQSKVSAPPAWIIFPKWQGDAANRLVHITDAEGFMGLSSNAFNYELLGEAGFRTVAAMIAASRCYRLEYSDLELAIALLDDLVSKHIQHA